MPVGRYRYTRLRWRLLVRVLDFVGAALMWFWRLARPARRVDSPRRILVVQLDHLGDAVLTSPIFPGLKAAYPGVRIDVLASASNRAIFEAEPLVDRVLVADRNWFERTRGGWSLAPAVARLAGWLRRERYDLGIDVRGDVLSVVVMALAGIPRRLGWAMGGGGFLLTDVADWVPGRHEVASRLALLTKLGIATDSPARVSVHVMNEDRARIAERLRNAWSTREPSRSARLVKVGSASNRTRPINRTEASDFAAFREVDPESLHAGRFGDACPLLAVHLGAGTPAKRWPPGSWARLIARFLDDGWRVVVIGGEEDLPFSKLLKPHERLRDWTGSLAVAESTALLERADLFIGADSGPAHLAAASGVTSLVLFSGTNNVRQWRPHSRRSLVLRRPVSCRPCHRKVCPLADHPCLSGLTPERVYRAARRWWSRLHEAEAPHAPL